MKKHANHLNEIPRVQRIIGQLEGIKKMIQEGRYCPEIMQQTRAVNSAVKALEVALLKGHLDHCITHAAEEGTKAEFQIKLKELLELIKN